MDLKSGRRRDIWLLLPRRDSRQDAFRHGGANAIRWKRFATASQSRDQSALAQGIESFQWRHQRPNGEIWDAMVHLLAFEHRGRRLLQATLEDITQRKKTEEAL